MTLPAARKPAAAPLSRPIIAVGIGSTVLIAVGAFVLSFASLTDLATRSGIDANLAWIWPIIVDGLIVAATVAIVALAGHDRKTLAYPWALLGLGAVVSTAANAVHAIVSVSQVHGGVPPVVSAVMAAMPPVILLAITHLTVLLVQKAAPAHAAKKKPAQATAAPRAAKRTPAPVALTAPPATVITGAKPPAVSSAPARTVKDRELVNA